MALIVAIVHNNKTNNRRSDYNHQKQYWPHEDTQNDNKQKTKMGRKTTLRTF